MTYIANMTLHLVGAHQTTEKVVSLSAMTAVAVLEFLYF